ncbi:MAG: DUF1592 domain-containing protein [Planctomycetota bacterium]|nr:DUF1592 domain-containing protein [Planctomycetota bacterium]
MRNIFLPSSPQTFARRLAVWTSFACLVIATTLATEPPTPVPPADAPDAAAFKQSIEPLLAKYCVRCHSADNMKSGVRVDILTADPEDRHIALLKAMRQQLDDELMPPENEPQPTAEERQALGGWITRGIDAARSRVAPKNGSVRRLTVPQYRNTLRDLLGLREDLTDALPPDGVSKDGFTNNAQTLALSPLQVETYFDIAAKALDLCIVDESTRPTIQIFRMDFGQGINKQPCPDNLVLGANNALLNNADFVVTELKPEKPFEYQPFAMRTAYEFIEGYVGNDTIRAWRKFDSIYHSVFACVRGSPGYPKGEAYQVIPSGLLLRPAIPSPEIFGQSDTYGPMANFKISLRELPDRGDFRVTVKAVRYDDGLLLDPGTPVRPVEEGNGRLVADLTAAPEATIAVPREGIYQVDVTCKPGKPQGRLVLELGDRQFAGQLLELPLSEAEAAKSAEQRTAFLVVRVPAGDLKLKVRYSDNSRLLQIALSPLPGDTELARRFLTFERRTPSLGVYVGLRRDCGSTLTRVGGPLAVSAEGVQKYVFEGAINDFPAPEVEKDNVNYLAGIREIGVRSEYTDGRDMPRLLIESIEFEGPYFETWPPATHRGIFIDSPQKAEPAVYAREVIDGFATRAFRRPVTTAESESLMRVWQRTFAQSGEALRSTKDALLVVLTSPQFLFLIENSPSPAAEDLDDYELASKLSYFLWNAPPDQRLLTLAANHTLRESLDNEIDRMVADPRFGQFVNEFGSQWLSLDKFDVVSVDAKRYPRLTRDAKAQLRQEPVEFLRHLFEENRPARNLIQSDFLVANEVVANYYGLGDRLESGFQFVAIPHRNENLGGVLSQAGILAGLSDGRESNPIKRGAWVARKIVAEPPDDPPPNVPKLPEDDGAKLSLREKLERHRNQKGCVKCHSGIDPWGIPFETMDAGGLRKTGPGIDARSKLPDGTEVADLNGLKKYLADDRIDQVAFSFLKHVGSYAIGRSLTYNELTTLREQTSTMRGNEYRLRDLLRFVIHSDLFLKK